MKKKRFEKTTEQSQIEDLIAAHGKLYVELGEIECKIMRLDGRLANVMSRDEDGSHILEIIDRLLVKREEKLISLTATKRAIEQITGTQEPEWEPPVRLEREVYPVQIQFLLE